MSDQETKQTRIFTAPATHGRDAKWTPHMTVSPFIRAPEEAKTIYTVIFIAACLPLMAGVVFFGWKTLLVAGLSVLSCVVIESLYFRVTRSPAMLGRSHAFLTGILLSLTLPAFAPWYIPIIASAFAIIIGKAFFGGVGHFLWAPALVGRLAVAVMFPVELNPSDWPILSQNKIIVGDVSEKTTARVDKYSKWRENPAPDGFDGVRIKTPAQTLAGVTRPGESQTAFSALARVPANMKKAKPSVIASMPPMEEVFFGAHPGGIGETCIAAILLAGIYLVYRNYVKWQLPFMIILSAAIVAALAPIKIAGPGDTIIGQWGPPGGWMSPQSAWLVSCNWILPPVLREGLAVGIVYVCYQLFSGQLFLAAFFFAPEMTSRPVTAGGQVLFGIGCGTGAMLLQLYVDPPIPAYLAVLAMNTLTPYIDVLWRPKVLGQRHFWSRWF